MAGLTWVGSTLYGGSEADIYAGTLFEFDLSNQTITAVGSAGSYVYSSLAYVLKLGVHIEFQMNFCQS